MTSPVQRYLARRGVHAAWPPEPPPAPAARAVVIPAMAESGSLFLTLESLAKNAPELLDSTCVVCVINQSANVSDEIRQDNVETLARLAEYRRTTSLHLLIVNACSPGRELPTGQGVGLARKIGMDWAAAFIDEERGLILSLDADTLVDANYLSSVADFFSGDGWAAVVPYAHDLTVPAAAAYELFLRYHAAGLHWAGSPYHYTAMGCRIVCTVRAYVAAGGMNRRLAGEDFYFLQELVKTGRVGMVQGTEVRPSARASARTPFGTGQYVQSWSGEACHPLYAPESYEILRRWLDVVSNGADCDGATLLHHAEAIDGALRQFLETERFAEVWGRLRQTHTEIRRLRREFHRWFDGLKTVRLLHHLRDSGHPDCAQLEAVVELMSRMGCGALARKGRSLGTAGLTVALRNWEDAGYP